MKIKDKCRQAINEAKAGSLTALKQLIIKLADGQIKLHGRRVIFTRNDIIDLLTKHQRSITDGETEMIRKRKEVEELYERAAQEIDDEASAP